MKWLLVVSLLLSCGVDSVDVTLQILKNIGVDCRGTEQMVAIYCMDKQNDFELAFADRNFLICI